MKINRQLATSMRERNAYLASEEGLARNNFLTKRGALTGEVVVSLRYGSATVGINGDGSEAPPDENGRSERITVHPSLLEDFVGSAPLNKRLNGLLIPCGVCLIVGGGGVGKTPLAWSLAASSERRDHEFEVVRIGEPLAGYASSDRESAIAILKAMHSSSDVVVDSIKDLLSSARGAAMKSGLSRDALSVLSAWSAAACATGTTLYIPVNPSTDDPEVMAMLSEAARSNATSAIVSKGKNRWEYFARTGEGLPRVNGEFNVSFGEDGWAVVGDDVSRGQPERELKVTVTVSPEVWNNSMRRAFQIITTE